MKNKDLQYSIGLKIRKIRENKLHISQKELAKKCNLDSAYFSRVENGKQNLTLETLEIICDALDVSLKELLDSDVENN